MHYDHLCNSCRDATGVGGNMMAAAGPLAETGCFWDSHLCAVLLRSPRLGLIRAGIRRAQGGSTTGAAADPLMMASAACRCRRQVAPLLPCHRCNRHSAADAEISVQFRTWFSLPDLARHVALAAWRHRCARASGAACCFCGAPDLPVLSKLSCCGYPCVLLPLCMCIRLVDNLVCTLRPLARASRPFSLDGTRLPSNDGYGCESHWPVGNCKASSALGHNRFKKLQDSTDTNDSGATADGHVYGIVTPRLQLLRILSGASPSE